MLEIRGAACAGLAETRGAHLAGASRYEAPNWLPGLVSHSVLRDIIQIQLPSIVTFAQRAAARRSRRGAMAVARAWQRMLDEGKAESRADLARRVGVSRARVSQVLGSGEA